MFGREWLSVDAHVLRRCRRLVILASRLASNFEQRPQGSVCQTMLCPAQIPSDCAQCFEGVSSLSFTRVVRICLTLLLVAQDPAKDMQGAVLAHRGNQSCPCSGASHSGNNVSIGYIDGILGFRSTCARSARARGSISCRRWADCTMRTLSYTPFLLLPLVSSQRHNEP